MNPCRAALFALWPLGLAAAVPLEDELQRCAAIAESAPRLACYDALAHDTPPAPPPEKNFGLPREQAKEEAAREPDTVRSRLAGPFKGWHPGSQFELANGQVWQSEATQDGFFPGVPDDAEVVIRRGFLGSYWMEVLGGQQTIKTKVRRLK